MQAIAWTRRRCPLPRDVWVRSVSAAARGKPVVACCSSSNSSRSSSDHIRASQPDVTALPTNNRATTSITALHALPRRQRRPMCTALAPSRAADGSWRGRSVSNTQTPNRRHVSLWGGRDKRTSSPLEGAGTSSGEDPSLLRRRGREEEVLAALSGVVEPCTGKGVIELGLVQDLFVEGEVSRRTGFSCAPHPARTWSGLLCWVKSNGARLLLSYVVDSVCSVFCWMMPSMTLWLPTEAPTIAYSSVDRLLRKRCDLAPCRLTSLATAAEGVENRGHQLP